MDKKKAETTEMVDTSEVKEKKIKTASPELEIGKAVVTPMSTPGTPLESHHNDVKFKVAYSKDHKGEKIMPEGETQIVSKESAAHFESLGIGKIVTE